MKIRNKRALVLGLAMSCGIASSAFALEDETPMFPGATITEPTGALPPPGIYFSEFTSYFDLQVKNAQGQSTGVTLHDLAQSAQFIWVPQMPLILGANYGAFVVFPFQGLTANTPGGDFSAAGMTNTVVSPLNLSWNLQNGIFVSFGTSLYPTNGTYHRNEPVNIARNYFTFEPDLAISYLANGWNASLHTAWDFNAKNQANGYQSGIVLVADYYVMHKFDKFEFGFGGTLTQQFTNDTINGVTVPAVPGVHGYGNRAAQFNIGPTMTYDFGLAKARLYYLQDVYAYNTGGGGRVYLGFDVPLYMAPAPKAAVMAKY